MVKGQYDRVKLANKSIWLRINPRTENQYYTYEIFDPEENKVVTVRTLWYRYIQHFVRGARGCQCSSGPRRDKACWNCAYVDDHYDRIRKEEKATGTRKSREESRPGVDTGPQFAFGVTYMENMYAVPVLDRSGHPRVSKSGQPIANYVPESIMGKNLEGLRVAGFGRAAHLSVSQRGLDQLLNADDYFCARHCRNCAREMTLIAMECPDGECPSKAIALEEELVGEEAAELMKDSSWKCDDCGHMGQFVPHFKCACGKPVSGSLTDFDVRIKQEKSSDDSKEKGGTIRITKVRLPKIIDKEVEAMVMNSLELDRIFAPTPLDEQARILGDRIKGLDSPLPRKKDAEVKGPPSSPYDDSGDKDDNDDEDSDEAEFD